jgi:hypothetical protein
MKRTLITLLCIAATLPIAQAASNPETDATILKIITKPIIHIKGKEPKIVDTVQYRPAAKAYKVQEGRALRTYKASEVIYCIAPTPPGFGKMDDIKSLEAVVKKYDHLWWDNIAGKKLMGLYLKNGDNAKAIRLYKNLTASQDRIDSSLRKHYWTHLLAAKQYDTLCADIDKAVIDGDRGLCAWAYIARGDMLLAKNEKKKALADGYMKTVAMFNDIVVARVVALRKVVAVMKADGDRRVDRFEKMLKNDKIAKILPEDAK